jgi:hypothetical protein
MHTNTLVLHIAGVLNGQHLCMHTNTLVLHAAGVLNGQHLCMHTNQLDLRVAGVLNGQHLCMHTNTLVLRVAGVLNGQTLLCEGRNLCSLLESAPALHAEYLDTFSDEAELEGDQGGSRQFLSLWAWLDVRLQEACTKASSAACTLCDDLPSVLLESGAWSELKSLQRSLGQLLGAWREMGRQNRQEVEVGKQ